MVRLTYYTVEALNQEYALNILPTGHGDPGISRGEFQASTAKGMYSFSRGNGNVWSFPSGPYSGRTE